MESMRELEEEFYNLDKMWEEYRERVTKVLEIWLKHRIRLLNEISRYAGVLSKIDYELSELEVKRDIGLINEEEYTKRSEPLKRKKEELEDRVNELRGLFDRFEKWAIKHNLRAGLPIGAVAGSEEVRQRLSELEKMFRQGEVDENLYRRLKAELQKLVELLESS